MKRLIVPVVVLIVVAVVWIVVSKREKAKVAPTVTENYLNLNCDKINRVVATSPARTVELVKQDDNRWYVRDSVLRLADQRAVEQILGRACTLSVGEVFSQNPDMQKEFNVVEGRGTEVSFYDNDSLMSSIIVGKMDPNMTRTYLRKEGSDDVYIVPPVYNFAFNMTRGQWMDKNLISCNPDSVASIEIYNDNRMLKLVPKPEDTSQVRQWTVINLKGGQSKGENARASAVFPVVRQACSLRAFDMIGPQDIGKVNFDPVKLTLIVDQTNGSADTVQFAQIPPGDNPQRFYARHPNGADTFVVPNMTYEVLAKKYQDLIFPK